MFTRVKRDYILDHILSSLSSFRDWHALGTLWGFTSLIYSLYLKSLSDWAVYKTRVQKRARRNFAWQVFPANWDICTDVGKGGEKERWEAIANESWVAVRL